MKARKKPIEVFAIQYNDNIILEDFLKLLRTNEKEPVRYDESDGTIYIAKERGEISLSKGNWIIWELNTDNCFWAIDHEIFVQTYVRCVHCTSTYKKKIYDVECIEFSSLSRQSIKTVLDFVGLRVKTNFDILQRDELIEEIKQAGYILIDTLEGKEKLYPSEILIKGIKGEFYPVSRENFDKVYDII